MAAEAAPNTLRGITLGARMLSALTAFLRSVRCDRPVAPAGNDQALNVGRRRRAGSTSSS
jgi:hypothetical protein